MLDRPRLTTAVFLGGAAVAEGHLTRTELRTKGYHRLVQGVYAHPAVPVDHRLRCAGVALLLPAGAVIGGHSAAAWHGAPFAATWDPVTVLRPPAVSWKGPRGVRVHRTELRPEDHDVLDDVPVSSTLRTAWDVAALEPLPTAVAALDAMVRAGAVTTAALARLPDDRAGRWGVARVREAVRLVDGRAESAPESRVRVALVRAGLAPVPQYEVRSGGAFVARVDLAWPAARLALEYEGAHHFVGTQIARDDDRLARLAAAGWRVIRIGSADLHALDAVVRRVFEALGE